MSVDNAGTDVIIPPPAEGWTVRCHECGNQGPFRVGQFGSDGRLVSGSVRRYCKVHAAERIGVDSTAMPEVTRGGRGIGGVE